MKNHLLLCLALFFLATVLHAQQPLIRFAHPINNPGVNNFAPFISGDERTLIYLNDYTDAGGLTMQMITKEGAANWSDPKEVNKQINNPTLNFEGGYSVSFDGQLLLFTSRRAGGIGGFDIWYSERRGNDWGAPKGFGAPLNSRGHDASPSLSPDGATLYFMRCERMDQKSSEGCKLYVSRLGNNGRWTEPEALPEVINRYNAMHPRIMADGESLIFSSDRPGGKGGFDLYFTRKENGVWTEPVNMAFANTEANDFFISVPSKGRYYYRDEAGARKRELVMRLIPEEFTPKRLIRSEGVVLDGATGAPMAGAFVRAVVIDTRERVWNSKTDATGAFMLVLKEGARYDFSIEAQDGTYSYFSKIYGLDKMRFSDRDELRVTLKKVEPEDLISLESVKFYPGTATIMRESELELRRLTRLIRTNSHLRFDLEVIMMDFKQDSVRSHPDLTEVRYDTLLGPPIASIFIDENGETREELVQEVRIKPIYHNDRSMQMAEALRKYLLSQDLPEHTFTSRAKREIKGGFEAVNGAELPPYAVYLKVRR
jgi:hypothetical protein